MDRGRLQFELGIADYIVFLAMLIISGKSDYYYYELLQNNNVY